MKATNCTWHNGRQDTYSYLDSKLSKALGIPIRVAFVDMVGITPWESKTPDGQFEIDLPRTLWYKGSDVIDEIMELAAQRIKKETDDFYGPLAIEILSSKENMKSRRRLILDHDPRWKKIAAGVEEQKVNGNRLSNVKKNVLKRLPLPVTSSPSCVNSIVGWAELPESRDGRPAYRLEPSCGLALFDRALGPLEKNTIRMVMRHAMIMLASFSFAKCDYDRGWAQLQLEVTGKEYHQTLRALDDLKVHGLVLDVPTPPTGPLMGIMATYSDIDRRLEACRAYATFFSFKDRLYQGSDEETRMMAIRDYVCVCHTLGDAFAPARGIILLPSYRTDVDDAIYVRPVLVFKDSEGGEQTIVRISAEDNIMEMLTEEGVILVTHIEGVENAFRDIARQKWNWMFRRPERLTDEVLKLVLSGVSVNSPSLSSLKGDKQHPSDSNQPQDDARWCNRGFQISLTI